MQCSHGKTQLLGEEKGEKTVNRYYKCLKCGSVLVLSEEGRLYELVDKKQGKQAELETF
jgi:hypothetical protein